MKPVINSVSHYEYNKEKRTLPHLFQGNNYELFEKTRSKKYHEYRKLWTEIPKKQQVLNFPIHISIGTSDNCNLRCPMCPRAFDSRSNKRTEDMSFDIYKRIIDEAADSGLYALRLNKQNEPLMTRNIAKYIKYAKDRNIVDVMINTNAVALTNEIGREIIESGLDKLNISIDSHIKGDYEAIRVGANFERVSSNIKGFFELRNKKKSITPFIRISKVTKHTEYNQLNSFINFWKPFCDEITSALFCDYNIKSSMFSEKKVSSEFVIEKCGICPQPWQRLEIAFDGKVYACCMEDNSMLLGNIKNSTLRDLWHGKRINQIRKMFARKDILSEKICRTCYASWYFTKTKNKDIHG